MAAGQAPTVTTTTVTTITSTTAIGGGDVTLSGSSTITARGVVYGILPHPTITGSSFTTTTGGTGVFTTPISGLLPDTTYFIRAYATNGIGTGYDSVGELSFETSAEVQQVTLSADGFDLWSKIGYVPGVTPTDEEVAEQFVLLEALRVLHENP